MRAVGKLSTYESAFTFSMYATIISFPRNPLRTRNIRMELPRALLSNLSIAHGIGEFTFRETSRACCHENVDVACKVHSRNGRLTEVAWPVQLMESQSRERGIAVVQSPRRSRSVRKEPRRSNYKGKIEIKPRPASSVEEQRKENS